MKSVGYNAGSLNIEGYECNDSYCIKRMEAETDTENVLKQKVKKMYTDPNHIKISDPGSIEGNIVFLYLDVFCEDEHFKKYLPEYNSLDDLKNHYQAGGLGDMVIKNFLFNILNELLRPIRERRK